MKFATQRPLANLIAVAWFAVLACTRPATAFAPSQTSRSQHAVIVPRRHRPSSSITLQSNSPDGGGENGGGQEQGGANDQTVPNDLGLEIIRGSDSDEISDETWQEIEGGAPSRWMVMKNLLGINIFTYILAAFIVFFLTMNQVFGPGWLGQSLGWEDVGTFTRTSDSLPLNVDVSGPEYLL